MKKSILFILALSFTSLVWAQKFTPLDSSPLDIAYGKTKDKKTVAKVIYSRPLKKDRVIFGELEPYGKVWRTGANEATEIKLYADVTIQGKTLKAGTYTLFTIPEKDKWTIIFNSEVDQWGAYSYKKEKDVLRLEVKPAKTEETVEAFSIAFKDANKGVDMMMGWDDVYVTIPMEFKASK